MSLRILPHECPPIPATAQSIHNSRQWYIVDIMLFIKWGVQNIAIYITLLIDYSELASRDAIEMISSSLSTSTTRLTSAVVRISSTAPAYIIRCEGLQFSGK